MYFRFTLGGVDSEMSKVAGSGRLPKGQKAPKFSPFGAELRCLVGAHADTATPCDLAHFAIVRRTVPESLRAIVEDPSYLKRIFTLEILQKPSNTAIITACFSLSAP